MDLRARLPARAVKKGPERKDRNRKDRFPLSYCSLRLKKTTCGACKRKKVCCDKTYPCSRCFRLCLHCRPQLCVGATATTANLMEHVLDRADYPTMAKHFIRVFANVYEKGHLDRHRILQML